MAEIVSEEKKAAIVERFLKSPFFRLLQLEIKELEKGRAVLAVKPREDLRQSVGLLHGGVIAALCDVSVAAALFTLVPDNQDVVTVEIKVNYLKAVNDEEIFACAEIIRQGKSIAVGDVAVIDKNGEHYAAALSTYAILPVKTE